MVNAPQTANHELVLTEGGPTYRIEKRLGTVQENTPRIVRRALLSICLTWFALLALAAFQGFAIGHRVEVPFLRDFAVHARFLLAVPILLLAETIVGPRVAEAARHFVTSGVVVEEDYGKFETAVARGLAWRDSTAAEVIFVVVSYAVTAVNLRWTVVHVRTAYWLGGVTHLGGLVARLLLHPPVSVLELALAMAAVSLGTVSLAHD